MRGVPEGIPRLTPKIRPAEISTERDPGSRAQDDRISRHSNRARGQRPRRGAVDDASVGDREPASMTGTLDRGIRNGGEHASVMGADRSEGPHVSSYRLGDDEPVVGEDPSATDGDVRRRGERRRPTASSSGGWGSDHRLRRRRDVGPVLAPAGRDRRRARRAADPRQEDPPSAVRLGVGRTVPGQELLPGPEGGVAVVNVAGPSAELAGRLVPPPRTDLPLGRPRPAPPWKIGSRPVCHPRPTVNLDKHSPGRSPRELQVRRARVRFTMRFTCGRRGSLSLDPRASSSPDAMSRKEWP